MILITFPGLYTVFQPITYILYCVLYRYMTYVDIYIFTVYFRFLAYMECLVNMLLLKGDANFRVSHQKYAIPAPLYGTHFNVDLK